MSFIILNNYGNREKKLKTAEESVEEGFNAYQENEIFTGSYAWPKLMLSLMFSLA